jgi:hypothetical protein
LFVWPGEQRFNLGDSTFYIRQTRFVTFRGALNGPILRTTRITVTSRAFVLEEEAVVRVCP